MSEVVKEEQSIFKQAENVKKEYLADFFSQIFSEENSNEQDVDAIVAGMMALFTAMSEKLSYTEEDGKSKVFWKFVREFCYPENRTMIKMIDFDWFMFPQFKDRFDRIIPKDVYETMKDICEGKLNDLADDDRISDETRKHWRHIVHGNLPYGYKIGK